jgi:hypothetical protein
MSAYKAPCSGRDGTAGSGRGMRYFKRPWNESRGDEHDDWGTSTWFIEVGPDLYITRQIEVYAAGQVLKYDEGHLEDAYGGLGEGVLDFERDGYMPFEIDATEFEHAWQTTKAMNRS